MTGTSWIEPDESRTTQREKAGQLIDMTRERESWGAEEFLKAMKPTPIDPDTIPDLNL